MKIKFCPRLLIFEPLDCTLGIFRGYDFSIFQILLFLDGYFGVFLLRPSSQPPRMFSYGVPPLGLTTDVRQPWTNAQDCYFEYLIIRFDYLVIG